MEPLGQARNRLDHLDRSAETLTEPGTEERTEPLATGSRVAQSRLQRFELNLVDSIRDPLLKPRTRGFEKRREFPIQGDFRLVIWLNRTHVNPLFETSYETDLELCRIPGCWSSPSNQGFFRWMGPIFCDFRMNLGVHRCRVKGAESYGNLPTALLYTHPGAVRING